MKGVAEQDIKCEEEVLELAPDEFPDVSRQDRQEELELEAYESKLNFLDELAQRVRERRLTAQLPNTLKLMEAFLEHKRAKSLAEESLITYRRFLSPFAKRYPALPLEPKSVEEFLAGKPGDKYKQGCYKVLSSFYKFASGRFGIPNVMEKVDKPRVKFKEQKSLSLKEVKMLLEAIKTPRQRALVYLYLGQGLRRSEAVRLNVSDIGEDRILIHGKERDEFMPLLEEVRGALRVLAGDRDGEEPLFIGNRGRLSTCMAGLEMEMLQKKCGFTGIRFGCHVLRHSFATLPTEAGCDTHSVKMLLRHSLGNDVTAGYIHLGLNELKVKLEHYSPIRLVNGNSDKPRGNYKLSN
jgi:integrase